MNCKTCEQHIINGDLDLIKEHIKSCDSCQLFLELHSHNPIKVKSELMNPYAVSSAFKRYEAESKRKNILSLVLFISIAILLMVAIITLMYGHYLSSLKYYIAFITTAMPLSLPILSKISRKAVL